MTTTLPLPVPWCATLISLLSTSTSPGQSLLDAPKYARKPFHWQLKIGCGCQNPTKALQSKAKLTKVVNSKGKQIVTRHPTKEQ
jgi:hypothetical protein